PTATPNSCTKSGSRPAASEQSRNVGPLAALAAGTPNHAIAAVAAPKPTSNRILRIPSSPRYVVDLTLFSWLAPKERYPLGFSPKPARRPRGGLANPRA